MEQWRKFLLNTVRGEIFRVDFIKRTTGEKRRMVCRTGVTKGVDNPGRFDKRDRRAGIVRVFDFQKRAFRSVPLDKIQELKWRGKVLKNETGGC
jgi:hypothetical protein